jgi:hypothetical protein
MKNWGEECCRVLVVCASAWVLALMMMWMSVRFHAPLSVVCGAPWPVYVHPARGLPPAKPKAEECALCGLWVLLTPLTLV